jgi:hypothetical protein
MLVYPQLGGGSLGQYPLVKRRQVRTLTNRTADGRAIKLADPGAGITEWKLQYSGLIEAEAEALREFFKNAEGTLQAFTFLDPTSNLLMWSETLEEAVWTRGPLLSIEDGIDDALGGTRAARLTNTGGGAQSLTQTLAAPGDYLYCLSAYVRAAQTGPVTMLMGNARAERRATTQWTRITLTATGEAGGESVHCGLETPGGSMLEVFGLQVEPQPAASGYKPSTTGGVYENARLRDDVLTMTATGAGLHSCKVYVIHANHI